MVIHVLFPTLVLEVFFSSRSKVLLLNMKRESRYFGARSSISIRGSLFVIEFRLADFKLYANPWLVELKPSFSARFELEQWSFLCIWTGKKRVCQHWLLLKKYWIPVDFCQISEPSPTGLNCFLPQQGTWSIPCVMHTLPLFYPEHPLFFSLRFNIFSSFVLHWAPLLNKQSSSLCT